MVLTKSQIILGGFFASGIVFSIVMLVLALKKKKEIYIGPIVKPLPDVPENYY